MAQPPAVVIIARHGMRLDAADQSWHMSTPTPYDPPLTYGGWNQCRALGVRIASLLHAREQSLNAQGADNNQHGPAKRRKRKHKVVIHTSPFLRCLQTSVAISAGMAQFEAPKDRNASKLRTPARMHSGGQRLRGGVEGERSPNLAPIAEPRHDFAHEMARKTLGEQKRYRKAKLRVDAFLGEWLNPGYFDQITPPPPSPMMITGAKAELLQNDAVDVFTPTVMSQKPSNNGMWGGSGGQAASRESPLDDWRHITDALPQPKSRRNSVDSVGSNESSGRKSSFRPGHALHPLTSMVPKAEHAIYHPPTPSYAISNSDYIPRGYVAHARNATVNVDYAWDSSRAPQDWGNGGEYGEEWSAMHRRLRTGLNKLMQWYSQHNADDRGEDALGIEQADKHHHHEDEEQEDLVVILVTHAAGSNALIGALTDQPVLLDVGMASLTMAVRKDDAPALSLTSPPLSNPATPSPTGTPSQSPDPVAMMGGSRRRSSLDIGLSAVYDMKLVSSSEHLRPSADPAKVPNMAIPPNMKNAHEALSRYKQSGASAQSTNGSGVDPNWSFDGPRRSNTSTAIGSIRRPSAPSTSSRPSSGHGLKLPPPLERTQTPPTFTAGLWTPPSGTPILTARKVTEERQGLFARLNDSSAGPIPSPSQEKPLELSPQSPPESRPTSSRAEPQQQDGAGQDDAETEADDLSDLPSQVAEKLPSSLSRGLSQKGLWGARPSGDRVPRKFAKEMPKRRWTTYQPEVQQNGTNGNGHGGG